MSYTNADGLRVLTFGDQGVPRTTGTTTVADRRTLVIDIPDFTALGTSAAAIDPLEAFIPAGSIILNATLHIETAATSAGSATLTIGTYDSAGTAIDADGIDAAIALTAIDAANDIVRCDGAQASGVGGYVAAKAYVKAIYATAAFTAGAGKVYIEYVKV